MLTINEKHAYNVEVAILYTDLIESLLRLRDYGKVPGRTSIISDEETSDRLQDVRPLLEFVTNVLHQSEVTQGHKRELKLAYNFIELAFSDVYFGWFDQKFAVSLLLDMNPTAKELSCVWDRVEHLIDAIYDDFDSLIFRQQKSDLIRAIAENPS